MTTAEGQGNALCPTPTKSRFATEEAAKAAALRSHIPLGKFLVPYDNCVCGWVHLTSELRETGPAYTEDQLRDMDQAEFDAVVRMDVTGRGHPDTLQSLRTNSVLVRWEDSLKVFSRDVEAQLTARAGDLSSDTRTWRGRIARVRGSIANKRTEVKRLRKDVAAAAASAKETERSAEVGDNLFSSGELRHVAGERALEQLKTRHRKDYLVFLLEEHTALGVSPSNALRRALNAEGLLDTDDSTDTEEQG